MSDREDVLRRLNTRITGATGKPGEPTTSQILVQSLLMALGGIRTGPVGLPPMPRVNSPIGSAPSIGRLLQGQPPNEAGFNISGQAVADGRPINIWRNEDIARTLANRPDPTLKSSGRWLSNTITPEQRQEIVRLYNDRDNPATLASLATRFQIDRTSIRRILDEAGMTIPGGIGRTIDLDRYLYLRTSGMSPERAAREIGHSVANINRAINLRANRFNDNTKGPPEGTPISVDSVVRALRDMEGVYATSRPAGRGTYQVDFYGNESRNRQLRLPLGTPRPTPENRLVVRHGHRPDALLGEWEGGRATRFDSLEALVNEVRGRTGRTPISAPPVRPANEPIVNVNPNQFELPLEGVVRKHHSGR